MCILEEWQYERKFKVLLNNILGKDVYLYDIFIIKYNNMDIKENEKEIAT